MPVQAKKTRSSVTRQTVTKEKIQRGSLLTRVDPHPEVEKSFPVTTLQFLSLHELCMILCEVPQTSISCDM